MLYQQYGIVNTNMGREMRLLSSSVLVLRVLMRLAGSPGKHINTDALAHDLAVSRHHLHKIVRYLADADLVCTARGARGGVMLALPAFEIRVGDVVRRHERDQLLFECFGLDDSTCPQLPHCRLGVMLIGAKAAFYEYLNQFTLTDCLAGPAAFANSSNTLQGTPS